MMNLKFRLTTYETNYWPEIPITINLNKIGELGKSQNSLPEQSNLSVNLIINLPEKGLSGSGTYRLVIARACKPLCYLYAKIVCPSIFLSHFLNKINFSPTSF